MSNSRRNFMKTVATTGAVSTLPVTGAVLACDKKDTENLAGIDISPFQKAIGEQVTLTDASGVSRKAVLAEVEELHFENAQHQRPAYIPKSASVVRFELDDTDALTGDVYQLRHSQLGNMDLLMSVVPDSQGVMGLEAVFS